MKLNRKFPTRYIKKNKTEKRPKTMSITENKTKQIPLSHKHYNIQPALNL